MLIRRAVRRVAGLCALATVLVGSSGEPIGASGGPVLDPAERGVSASGPVAGAPSCPPRPRGPFAPVALDVPGLGTFDVQSLPRTVDRSGAISSPAPTDFNPAVFAWDNESARIGARGNVLLTAHTFRADESALGNRLLSGLGDHEVLRIEGARHRVACYRVVERLEVAAEDYPVDRVYLDRSGNRTVITVCSDFDGTGWATRTVWFLEPTPR